MKLLCQAKVFNRLLVVVLFLFISAWSFAQNFPEVKKYAVDYTETLSSSELNSLGTELSDLHKEKGSQIVVVMISTTGDTAIEDYANTLFRNLKIGRKDIDDGILMLIAKDDHEMRIEVGYGLEGAVPDIKAKQIIDEQITPEFKEDNYYKGIQNGVSSLEALIREEDLPPPVRHMHITNEGITFLVLMFTGFILGLLVGLNKISWKTVLITLLIVAIVCATLSYSVIPFIFTMFTIFPGMAGFLFAVSRKARIIMLSILAFIAAGLLVGKIFGGNVGAIFLFAPIGLLFLGLMLAGIVSMFIPQKGHASSSGWRSSSSSDWSSSSSSSFSSSDSFSGDGGSSGGGGASGSW